MFPLFQRLAHRSFRRQTYSVENMTLVIDTMRTKANRTIALIEAYFPGASLEASIGALLNHISELTISASPVGTRRFRGRR